ncbi:MAG: hypothetical protein J5748_04200 [Bacteroidales bacterium]|nr:hypothetical protein [Bacteroidales bacterium]
MERFARFLFVLIIIGSCSKIPGAISLRRGDTLHRDIHRESDMQTNGFSGQADSIPLFDEPEVPPHIYACGVEHPESDAPTMVVFKDGVRVFEYTLKVPSTDADAHFLDRGDMYVAVTEGLFTTVYKNGVKEFSFPGREYISALVRREDGVWTLGADRGGDGFALRRDGVQVFAKTSGIPGRLYQDCGSLYFDYSLKMGDKTFRYLVKDGDDFALTSPHGGELRAVSVSHGEMWFLEDDEDGWMLSCGNREYHYPERPGFSFRSAELFGKEDGCSAAINLVAAAVGMPAELVCSEEETWLKGGGSGSYHYFENEPDVHLTLTRDMSQLSVSSFGFKGEERIDSIRFEGARCAMQYCGQIYLACTPIDGSQPFIWKRGNMRMPLDLQGYLTGIYVAAPD